MQNILKENFSDLEKDFPYTIQGKDKEGRPCKLRAVLTILLMYQSHN